ncbi:rod shape-determining protein MreC [Sphingomonas hankookensis]|uniref:Cell shape-determining protein MreC n=1 Tax=Sphingomonas hengshuiensis TaxID=1609977 RepID=A0A2W4Z5M8_9SPHN|nr:MAG: rod shape-determining protein MreC [Sphingomonas hengshuiensis]
MAPPRNHRPGFSRRAQYTVFAGYVLAASGALVGAILLLISIIDPRAFAALRGAVREATTPISAGLDWAWDGVASVPRGIGDYFGAVDENRRLRAREEATRRYLMQARLLNRENARLRSLLTLRDRSAAPVITARLVNSSASSTRRFATLNAGSSQGVRRGQPVRGPNGLIGRVVETSPNTASVLLILDPESIVPVRRTRDGLSAIVAGQGNGMVEVRTAGVVNAPLLAGDVFVTSGTGGIYPPGVPVARVSRSQRDVAPARVFADPDGLDFALVERAFLPAPVPRPTPSPTPTPRPAAE